jgi:hypothetical protein
MGFFPSKIQALIDLVGGWKIGGTQVTATAAELNKLHGVTASTAELNLSDQEAVQTLVADGAITVKNGICIIAKTVAGVVNATLADPTAGDDDFKRLTIINGQTQANVITSASSFGGGGGGEDVATFAADVGNTLCLMAYGGKWYVTGSHQVTIA